MDRTPYFGLSLRSLSESQRANIRSLFGNETIRGLETLRDALDDPHLSVLEIADRHTLGLGGPIDNRQAVDEGQRTDFVDLVFNIGAPQDTDLGGGTFGFGKIATYAMSSTATVLMISRPRGPDGRVAPARLIGSAIGDAYDEDGIRFTGRHWWGRPVEGAVQPVMGPEADELVAGVFDHAPPDGVTGTTILVLAPDLDGLPRHDSHEETGLNKEEAAHRMVSALLWSAWPKLVPFGDESDPPMDVEVLLDGESQDIPDPATSHPFIGFTHALQIVRREQRKDPDYRREPHTLESRDPMPMYVTREAFDTFASQRPHQLVGVAAIAETMRVPGTAAWEGDALVAESMGVTGSPRHLALMRQAELVVRYDEGPEHPDAAASMSWGGVFRTEVEVDDAFAAAEPPTHDRWIAGGLGRPRSTFVRRANKHGPRELYEKVFTGAGAGAAAPAGDLAWLVTEHLGGLVGEGEAPSRSRSGGGGGRPSGLKVHSSVTRMLEGEKVVVVEFSAPEGAVVRVTGAVALAGGGRDEDLPVRTLGFSEVGGVGPSHVEGNSIRCDGQRLLAWVAQPPDATVRVAVDRVE